MKNKRIRCLLQEWLQIIFSLSALVLVQSTCWALGSNVASFTYTGNQQGFTTGTVYTLSTDNQSLGFCQLTPDSSSNSGYSAQCFTNYGNQDSSLYSAVAYLGTTNNPNNSFVVGDGNGNLYLAQLNFQSSNASYVVPGLVMTSVSQGCPSGSSVSNLAVDPNGQYLYVGCSGKLEQSSYSSNFSLPTYLLYSVPINSNGSLGNFQAMTGLFNVLSSNSYTAALWSGVSPVMRSYPANSPNLSNSTYSNSGAVMVSGLVGGLSDNNTAKHAPGPVPASAGVICSNGYCGVAYSFTQAGSDSFSVFTAAEAGIDYYNGNFSAALYSNQVAGGWTCYLNSGNYCIAYSPTIPWNKTSNTIYSCNIANNPIGNQTFSCGSGSYVLNWTANGMPSAGNGLQVDISNLLFIPSPSNVSSTFTKGLLTIGTWSNGYLSYHSPATTNNSTAMFMSGNGSNGQVGNVNSVLNDSDGNLMYTTSTSGLFVFNPFSGVNTANGSNITLIPNTVDESGSGSGVANKILTGAQIAYYTVSSIGKVAVLASTHTQSNGDSILISGFAIGRALGQKPYRGQFLYKQDQLREMGLENNSILRGIRLRSSQGISPGSDNTSTFRSFKVMLSQAKSIKASDNLKMQFNKNIGKNRKVVNSGPLVLGKKNLPENKVYPDSQVAGDFGSPIWFDKPYVYLGGDILIDITHNGQSRASSLLIDAFGTSGIQGVFKPLITGGEVKGIKAVPAIDFIN